MRTTFLSAIALTASVLCLNGQTSTAPTVEELVSRRVQRLTRLLDLSSAQQAQATTIFTTEANALSPLRTSMQEAHTALRTAVQSNNTANIATLSTQIGNIVAQETRARATAQAAFYAILTIDQRTKFEELGPGGGGRDGHRGGPGPLGGGGMGFLPQGGGRR
jgi:Spy/CpxP family protein refolding chaperone